MAATTTTSKDATNTFITVPGDRHSEVAPRLAEPVPQPLNLLDQFGLWGNLGVSLLGLTGAIFVLQPGGTGTPELPGWLARRTRMPAGISAMRMRKGLARSRARCTRWNLPANPLSQPDRRIAAVAGRVTR